MLASALGSQKSPAAHRGKKWALNIDGAGRRACELPRTSPHLLVSIAVRPKLVRFPAPSHLAQRDVAKTNDAPSENILPSGAKANPKVHPADVPMEGIKSASATRILYSN